MDIKVNQETGRSRGFGFLAFTDKRSVEPCLANAHYHFIRGKWVDVKRNDKGGAKGATDKGKGSGPSALDGRPLPAGDTRSRSVDDKGGQKGLTWFADTQMGKGHSWHPWIWH